jgi:hypothetical protein
MIIKLVYIGEDYYRESHTIMSSIYTEDGERFDWVMVTEALSRADEVHLRPARKSERLLYARQLREIQRRWAETQEQENRENR